MNAKINKNLELIYIENLFAFLNFFMIRAKIIKKLYNNNFNLYNKKLNSIFN